MITREITASALVILSLLLPAQCIKPLEVPAVTSEDGKALKIDLDDDHSVQLQQHWMEQAMSGLMFAVATKKLEGAKSRSKEKHEVCSKDATSLTDHAKCVVHLLDSEKKEERRRKAKEGVKTSERRRNPFKNYNKDEMKAMNERRTTPVAHHNGQGRRPVVSASSYSLKSSEKLAPFSTLAKSLTKTVRQLKKKDDKTSKDWRDIVEDVQKESKKMKARRTVEKMIAKKLAEIQGRETNVDERRPLAMKELEDLDESDPQVLLREARRMESKLIKDDDPLRQPLNLIREAVKLGMMASGQNTSGFDDATLKLISPRLMSVLPEEEDNGVVKLLSPSLFSLHGEGKGLERATSLADGFGLVKERSVHEEWLNLIMEASGVSDAVEQMKEEKLKKGRNLDELRSPSGQPLYFTKENVTEIYGKTETDKIDAFERLQETYSPEQLDELKRQGHFHMRTDQLRLIYGPSSPYHDEERLASLSSVSSSSLPHHIEQDIRDVAAMDSFSLRHKDLPLPAVLPPVLSGVTITNTPLIYQSELLSNRLIVLSPLILSPIILSPAILGSVVLSPTLFVPVILSARAFAPLILSPRLFSPLILSPLLAHPFILCPGVFSPAILSPFLLSPTILSPQAFSPLILSPFALSPVILSPMVGSPVILSPFVLSPVIWSPQVLFAMVLSPYALSPLIQSPAIAAQIVLSPSWLS